MTDEAEKSPIEKLFAWYDANIPLRVGAAALAIPTHGASALFDVAVTSGLAYLRRKRMNLFRNDLITLNFQPTEEEVRSEEFLEAFLATASRIQHTRRDEKIWLLTRLFTRFRDVADYSAEAFDQFDEDLSVLDEVGLQEFSLLLLLHRFEERHPMLNDENYAQRTHKYWKEFQESALKQLGIEPAELESYLQRTSRTGLYQPVTGAFLNYTGGRGYLTGRFYRLREKIEATAASDIDDAQSPKKGGRDGI